MILIYSDKHEPAPTLDIPVVETNPERRIRPIYKKIRKVRGKTGYILRHYGWWFGAPKNDQVALGHHALQIGSNVYELTREKYLIGQRLTGHQIWPSTIKHYIIGYTDLSDADIQNMALKAESNSRSRCKGKYHIKYNNCQHFINDLLDLIMNIPLEAGQSETSSMKTSSTSSTLGEVEKAVQSVVAAPLRNALAPLSSDLPAPTYDKGHSQSSGKGDVKVSVATVRDCSCSV